jgi:hypothetical protein
MATKVVKIALFRHISVKRVTSMIVTRYKQDKFLRKKIKNKGITSCDN